jgi:hypothetical protein
VVKSTGGAKSQAGAKPNQSLGRLDYAGTLKVKVKLLNLSTLVVEVRFFDKTNPFVLTGLVALD